MLNEGVCDGLRVHAAWALKVSTMKLQRRAAAILHYYNSLSQSRLISFAHRHAAGKHEPHGVCVSF